MTISGRFFFLVVEGGGVIPDAVKKEALEWCRSMIPLAPDMAYSYIITAWLVAAILFVYFLIVAMRRTAEDEKPG